MVNNNTIYSAFKSDHSSVRCTLKLDNEKRGRGFWKLNCTLLEDLEYRTIIEKCIAECVQDNCGTDGDLLWDTIKCRVRGCSIKYSSYKKRENHKHIKELEDALIKLKNAMPNAIDPTKCAAEINDMKNS